MRGRSASFALVSLLALLDSPAVVAYGGETSGRFEATGFVAPVIENEIDDDAGFQGSITNVGVGGSFAYSLPTRMKSLRLAVEGEFAGIIGIEQDVEQRGRAEASTDVPNLLVYNGNLLVAFPGRSSTIAPYLTVGFGAVTLLEDEELGIKDSETDPALNFGGGVKWFFSDRWGLRGDFREFAIFPSEVEVNGVSVDPDIRYWERIAGGVVARF